MLGTVSVTFEGPGYRHSPGYPCLYTYPYFYMHSPSLTSSTCRGWQVWARRTDSREHGCCAARQQAGVYPCTPARLHASARLHACTLLAAVRLALVFRPFRTVEPVGLSSVPACLCVPVLVLTARLWPFTLVSRHACAPACLHTCL